MKMIKAILKPFKLDEAKEALIALGVSGMTVAEVRGHGRQKGHTELYRGSEYQVDFVPKVELTVVVASDQADAVVDAICKAANSGKVGDGKIFILDVVRTVRIRTGEEDESAV